MTGNEGTSHVMVTLPTKYMVRLKRLKDGKIISSYAEAVRDALIEWFGNHDDTLELLLQDE